MKDEICKPVGYKAPKRNFDELNKSIGNTFNSVLNDVGKQSIHYDLYHNSEQLALGGTITDFKKLSMTKNAYQTYKKVGWKASFE